METPVRERLHVLPDSESLSRRAASLVVTLADAGIEAKGTFSIALSGGDTPKRLFTLLGSEYAAAVPWSRVHFFWVDERCVPKDHEESNFKHAYERWLSRIAVPEENIHRIRGELSPEDAAARYEDELRGAFGGRGLPSFGLILLGMGSDGHTASLFPGAASLDEKERTAIAVYADTLKSRRVTLTLPVLNNADHVLFLVSGSARAEVLGTIFDPERRRSVPAGLVQPARGVLTWLVDEDAARNVPSQVIRRPSL